jgi:hypothetical protein
MIERPCRIPCGRRIHHIVLLHINTCCIVASLHRDTFMLGALQHHRVHRIVQSLRYLILVYRNWKLPRIEVMWTTLAKPFLATPALACGINARVTKNEPTLLTPNLFIISSFVVVVRPFLEKTPALLMSKSIASPQAPSWRSISMLRPCLSIRTILYDESARS